METGIQKFEVCPQLKESEKNIVLASRTKAIFQLEQRDIITELLHPFKELYLITGHKTPSDMDCIAQIKLLVEKIKKEYANIKINEVILAMKSGAYGDYEDDVVYVSPKNILKWIGDYQNAKHEALRKQLDYEKSLKEINEKEERKQKEIDYFNNYHHKIAERFWNWHNTRNLHKFAWLDYEILDKLNLIDLTDEQKKNIYKDIEEKEKVRRRGLNPFEMRALRYEPEQTYKQRMKKESQAEGLRLMFEKWEGTKTGGKLADEVKKLVTDNIDKLIRKE